MQIKDISRISLTPRRTAENQRYLTVGNSLLGQVIVNDQRIPTGIAEILSDGSSCKRSKILQSGRVGSSSGNYDSVVQCSTLLQHVHDIGNSRTFLSHGYINTVNRFACFVIRFLIQDGIDGNGGLSRLTVADNQFTLSATDRNHGIDRLQTGL